jgi:RING-H2 zinc finger domain
MADDDDEYREVYGFGLLDDIHHLFPELLYDSYIFPNDTDSNRHVAWLRFRVSRMFPQTYRTLRTQYDRQQAERNRADYDEWLFLRQRSRVPVVSFASLLNSLNTIEEPVAPRTSMFPLLQRTSRFHLHIDEPHWMRHFFDSVPVFATSEQIEAATELLDISGVPVETICAVCQEHDGAAWRQITACGHRFHRECIDTWFACNAHCPVCRADIRDATQHTETHPHTEDTPSEMPPAGPA